MSRMGSILTSQMEGECYFYNLEMVVCLFLLIMSESIGLLVIFYQSYLT